MTTATLTPQELAEITGYQRPAAQLRVLRERGYWRAWRASTGRVVLERAHYEAVCSGQAPAPKTTSAPRPPALRPPRTQTPRTT
jgi:hypothetical protein